MLKNTEAIICLYYFPTNFPIVPIAVYFPTNFPIVPMAAIWYSRPTNFPIVPMAAI